MTKSWCQKGQDRQERLPGDMEIRGRRRRAELTAEPGTEGKP